MANSLSIWQRIKRSLSSINFGWKTRLLLLLGATSTLVAVPIACLNHSSPPESKKMELMLCAELFLVMAQGRGYNPVMMYDDGLTTAMEARTNHPEGLMYLQVLASVDESVQFRAERKDFTRLESTCSIGGREVPIFVRRTIERKA